MLRWGHRRPPAAAHGARLGAAAAVVAALCYSSFLLSAWTGHGSWTAGGFISQLEDPGQPYAGWYRLSDVAAGVAIVLSAWALRTALPAGRRFRLVTALVLTVGAASVVDGSTTMSCDPADSSRCAAGEHSVSGLLGQLTAAHTCTGLIGFGATSLGAIVLGAALADRDSRAARIHIGIGSFIGACGILDLLLLLAGLPVGSVERARTLATSVWLFTLGWILLRSVRARTDRP